MKNKSIVFVIIVSFIGLTECDGLELNVPDEVVFVIGDNETTELSFNENFNYKTESDFVNFELTCSGDKPVQWSTEVFKFLFDYTSVHNGSKYYSILMFRSVSNINTGYFNCSYIGEEGGDSKSTYIYVHDLNDGAVFLMNAFPPFIILNEKPELYLGELIQINCRTSRPDIEVNLYINDMKVSRLHYKFDPRVGVILENLIGFPDQTSIKEIKCKNNYSNDEEFSFEPEISLRKPFIENHYSSDYLVGEEIALNCSMYMNEKYKPDFKWTLPNINAIRELKEFRNRSLSISILIIKNTSLSDSGQYVCTVSVLNLFESNTTKNIEIHAKPETEFSEIPSLLPPDKNINVTLFITQSHFVKSQPDVSCYLEKGCPITIDICVGIISEVKTKLEKDIVPLNRYKAVFSIRPSTSGLLRCNVWSGDDFSEAETYLNVSDKTAPFMVAVHTENAFVNLTRPGTLETINATEGDNISIACFALRSLYNFNSFTSGNTSICDTKLSLGKCLNIKSISLREEWVFECIAQSRITNIIEKISFRIHADDEDSAPSDKNLEISIESFIIVVIIVISFSVAIFSAIKIKKKKKNIRNDMLQLELFLFQEGKADKLNKECTIEEQAELLPYDHSYEVERENITLGKQLGTGAFGRVLMAQVKGLNGKESPTRVAIKMCKYGGDKTHLRALIMELKIMIHLGKHLNIVNLMGAHTSNIDKGELWILVEYCKYGNLLKFIQRAKAKFINQIDPVTSDIEVGRTSPFPNNPLSPKLLECSFGYGRTSNLNSDAYLDSHPGGSMEIGQPMGGRSSTTSNTRFTTKKHFFPNSSAAPSGDKHYELPPSDPTPRKESSISDSDYDFTYHLFLNSNMIEYSQPPSSPTSPSTSECQEKSISSDSENIPGVSAPLTTADLLCWAWQVANGMEYLTSRKVLHGDLAARNLLLAENNVVKICDFGLSREMYKNYVYLKKSSDAMPIKWMAPEAIEQKIFSTQSDVWSYGVTLWEMLTLGNTPFPGLNLHKFATALKKGMRLEKPEYCNDQIYSLLLHCWRSNPVERPRFNDIADILSDMLNPMKTKTYVNMNNFYKQKNEEWLSRHEDYLDMVTSPDFQNIQSPMSEEGVILGPIENLNTEEYISFLQSQNESRPIIDGGYLDVKFVRKPKPKSAPTSWAPSTQAEGPNDVFVLKKSEKASEEKEEELPAEVLASLEKPEESSIRRSPNMELSPPSGDTTTVPMN